MRNVERDCQLETVPQDQIEKLKAHRLVPQFFTKKRQRWGLLLAIVLLDLGYLSAHFSDRVELVIVGVP